MPCRLYRTPSGVSLEALDLSSLSSQRPQVIASRALVEDVLRELLPPGAFVPADTRPALPPALQQHHHNPHAAGADSGPIGDTPPGTRTATGTGVVTGAGTAGRAGPTPALPLLLCAQLDNSTVEVPRWRMPADAGGSAAPSVAGATVDPTVYTNRVQEGGSWQCRAVRSLPFTRAARRLGIFCAQTSLRRWHSIWLHVLLA